MSDNSYMVATRCWVYNHENFINDALQGFALQETSFPTVYLIVDDASTDGSQDVIKHWVGEYLDLSETGFAYQKKMPYGTLFFARNREKPNSHFVVLLLEENHYQTGRGAQKFQYISEWSENAKYHALCEGDDYWTDPEKLQKQVMYLESHPDYTLCCHNARKYYVQEDRYEDFCKYKQNREISAYDAVHKWIIATASMLFRREMNTKPDWEARIYSGDYSLILRCLYYGKIYYLKDTMSVYRFNMKGGSMTAMVQEKPFFVFEQHMKVLNSFLNAPEQRNKKVIRKRICYLKNEIDFNKTKGSHGLMNTFLHVFYGGKKFLYNMLYPVVL